MFFEGSEKKFELVARGASFRSKPFEFWKAVVELAGAKILSRMSNSHADAYLLSESSLFVWDDRITMITCGRTNLVKAALRVIEELRPEQVEFLSFERKNEAFPHQQETDFHFDLRELQKHLHGKAFRFGSPDEHHLFLYHLDRPFEPAPTDFTLEILMYNLRGQASQIFNCDQTIENVRRLTRMDQIFPGFQIDDHLFSPCGYSLNAIRGEEYYTIHVTPEESCSYVSFETNVKLWSQMGEAVNAVTEVFQPASFDVIYFHPAGDLDSLDCKPFIQRNYVRERLTCGFEIGFSTYYQKPIGPQAAIRLEMSL